MDYSRKNKIKKFFKERYKFIIGSGIFLTIGATVALVGFQIAGWSIVEWLKSPFATTTIIFLVVGGFLLLMAFLLHIIKKSINM